MERQKGREHSTTRMGTCSWETSTMTRRMARENTCTGMGKFMKGFGSMICNMATGGKKCQTAVVLKDSLPVGVRMVTVCTDGLIRPCTKGNGSRER